MTEPISGDQLGRRDRASADLRSQLVDAAVVEFAAHGFDGASTRAIARRAGAHQPQINYHFESKDALWRVVTETLLGDLDEILAAEQASVGGGPDVGLRDQAAALIRGLVRFSAGRPELNRIVIHEATAPSERLTWLVDTHLRERADALHRLWERLVAAGLAVPVPRNLVYHLLVGSASLLHANAPEARLLFELEPTDPAVVEAHAEALVVMYLPPSMIKEREPSTTTEREKAPDELPPRNRRRPSRPRTRRPLPRSGSRR